MSSPDRQEISFLDDDGRELRPDEVGDDVAADRALRRRALVEQWLPDGGGAALAALVFVVVGWLGASPLVQAVGAVAPVGLHRIGPLTEDSLVTQYGSGVYHGVTPGLIPVITYGTRALIMLIGLGLGVRARVRERSALATAAVCAASISVVLMLLAGVLVTVGLALGHGDTIGTNPF